MLTENICIIDFETTGADLLRSHPIEIGAVLVDSSFSIIDTFSSYIKPPLNTYNTDLAYKIHGITIESLKDSPLPQTVLKNFFSKLGTDYCLGGWNISFDIPFLKRLCIENNFLEAYNKINYRHTDVQTICKVSRYLNLIPSSIESLTECAHYFSIDRNIKHDALSDAFTTLEVLKKLMEKLEKGID